MRRSRHFVIVAASLVAAMGVAPGAAASALVGDERSPGWRELPVSVANPDVPRTVIEQLPEAVQQSQVVIDDGFVPGSPIVYPDGTPVEGQAPDVVARIAGARADCGGRATGSGLGSWGAESTCGVAVFGSPGYVRGYSWWVPMTVSAKACAQGRGFNSQGVRTWYGLGVCGSSHYNFGVPWGNILSNPSVRVKSMSPPSGVTVDWSS